MIKKILISAVATSMMLFLLSACADDEQASSDAAETSATKASESVATKTSATTRASRPALPAPPTPEPRALKEFQSAAIMSEPVDFSSPEQITASMEKIKSDAGDEAAIRVQNTIDYLLVYDLGVGRNQQKLNAKLNGKTPNEILAMKNR